jgi:hypothetical protein
MLTARHRAPKAGAANPPYRPRELQLPGSGLIEDQGIHLTGRWTVGRMCTGPGAVARFRLPLLPYDVLTADLPKVRVHHWRRPP